LLLRGTAESGALKANALPGALSFRGSSIAINFPGNSKLDTRFAMLNLMEEQLSSEFGRTK
jgi:hypothetical protein